MNNIEHYYQMVESIITKLGVDPATCRGEQAGQYNLKKGTAYVRIDVWKMKDQDYGYLQIIAPICDFPVNGRDVFMNEVLEKNHTLYGVSFTKYKEGLFLRTIRELDNLEEEEAMAMFNRIGNYADEYDDYFKNKYFGGGEGGGRASI